MSGSSGPRQLCLTLQMKALRSFENLVIIYKTTRLNIPDDVNIHQHRCEILKYRYKTILANIFRGFLQFIPLWMEERTDIQTHKQN
jgi:hypothetical protein